MDIKLEQYDLYANGYVEEFSNGEKYLERDHVDYEGDETDNFYTITSEDILTKIAFKWYRGVLPNPNMYWWIIADANDIENPLDLTDLIGQEIVIPSPLTYLLKL